MWWNFTYLNVLYFGERYGTYTLRNFMELYAGILQQNNYDAKQNVNG